MHVPYRSHAWSIEPLSMCHSYYTHIPCICNACAINTPCTFHAYLISAGPQHSPGICQTHSMYTSSIFHIYLIHIPFIFHTCPCFFHTCGNILNFNSSDDLTYTLEWVTSACMSQFHACICVARAYFASAVTHDSSFFLSIWSGSSISETEKKHVSRRPPAKLGAFYIRIKPLAYPSLCSACMSRIHVSIRMARAYPLP